MPLNNTAAGIKRAFHTEMTTEITLASTANNNMQTQTHSQTLSSQNIEIFKNLTVLWPRNCFYLQNSFVRAICMRRLDCAHREKKEICHNIALNI